MIAGSRRPSDGFDQGSAALDGILYRSENEGGRTTVSLERLEDGSLQIFYYDIGEDCRRMYGDSDYEAWVKVAPGELAKLAFALLADKYAGRHDAMSDFEKFCRAGGIEFNREVWI